MENKFKELNDMIGQPVSDLYIALRLKGWSNVYSGSNHRFPDLRQLFGFGDVLVLVSENETLTEIHSIESMEQLAEIQGEEIDIFYFEK